MPLRTPYNKIFQKQSKGLIPATFKKAVISSIDPQGASANVFIVGNTQTIINNVPFASSIDVSSVQQGDKCRLDCFDESNPSDMVIAYIYSKPFRKKYSKGNATAATGGISIAHGMGLTPDIVGLTLRASGTVYEYANADSTYIYLKSASGSIAVDWYTIKF